MSDEILGIDLFGDAVLARKEGRGRPSHEWTRENSNKVLLAFARGYGAKEAATAIGVSVPTLRKVYFSECSKRQASRLRLEMTQLARLNAAAEAGNVAAEKELLKRMDKARIESLSERIANPRQAPAPKLGKKAQLSAAAGQVEGKFAPPPAPQLLN